MENNEQNWRAPIVAEGLVRHFGDVKAVDGVDPKSTTARSSDSSVPMAPARAPSSAC